MLTLGSLSDWGIVDTSRRDVPTYQMRPALRASSRPREPGLVLGPDLDAPRLNIFHTGSACRCQNTARKSRWPRTAAKQCAEPRHGVELLPSNRAVWNGGFERCARGQERHRQWASTSAYGDRRKSNVAPPRRLPGRRWRLCPDVDGAGQRQQDDPGLRGWRPLGRDRYRVHGRFAGAAGEPGAAHYG